MSGDAESPGQKKTRTDFEGFLKDLDHSGAQVRICSDVFRICVWRAHESAKNLRESAKSLRESAKSLRKSAKVSEKYLRVCVCDAHGFGPCALHINICAFMPLRHTCLSHHHDVLDLKMKK